MARTSKSTAQYAMSDADDRAHQRDEETLGQHLPNEPPAGRAERAADGQFLRAQGGAAELHVHHVHARDQQNDDDRAEHRVNGLAQLRTGECIEQRLHAGRDQAARSFSDCPSPFASPARRIPRSPGRGSRPAFSRPMIAGPIPGEIAARFERKLVVKRHPKLFGDRELKVRRHDADDGGGLAINPDRLPDDVRIAVEIALPDFVTEDRRPSRRPACCPRP